MKAKKQREIEYVSTSFVPERNKSILTPNKKYKVLNQDGYGCWIKNDKLQSSFVLHTCTCAFLDQKQAWTPHYKKTSFIKRMVQKIECFILPNSFKE